MRLTCEVNKSRIQTHSKYLTLIAFPQKQLLHEFTSVLRYAYIGLSCYSLPLAAYCTRHGNMVTISARIYYVDSSSNVMAHGDARDGK